MNEQLLNHLNLYIWAKDKSSRYIFCNENYAAAAGADSPSQMIGKTDAEMPWRALADDFRRGDYAVIQGESRVNSVEKSDTVNGITDTLVSETQYRDSTGKCIGVIGSFLDITGKRLARKSGYFDHEQQRFYIDADGYDNTYLTVRELQVFKRLLLGWPMKQIAVLMDVSVKTIESYVIYIKRKFGVKNKADIVSVAIQLGLTHVIDLRICDK